MSLNTRGERCIFGEDGKSGKEHVTFSSLAYYINKKGVTSQTKYDERNYEKNRIVRDVVCVNDGIGTNAVFASNG